MVSYVDLPGLVSIVAEGGPDIGRAVGRLHPIFVHFPIALGIVAVLAEWWRVASRRSGMSPLTLPLLAIAAASAVVAASTGWVNAAHEYGNDGGDTLNLHRWIGTGSAVALVGLTWWCWTLSIELAKGGAAAIASLGSFRWAALVGAAAIGFTGHLGGDLVYGKGYLTEVLFPPTKSVEEPKESESTGVVSLSADEQFFLNDVRPILEANCFECHGPRKQKGGLRMDTKAWLFNGEEADWSVLPGKAAESLLVHRVELDRADPDAMPPEGDGLSADEIAKIRTWIDAGAPYPAGVATGEAMQPSEAAGSGGGAALPGISATATNAAIAALGTVAIAGNSAVEIPASVRSKADAAAKALIARGVLVQPLAAGSALLDVNAMRADPPLGDADAGLLADLAPVVANLNLAKSAITDAGLAQIGAMPNLERLRLDGTVAGDAGLSAFGALPRLESINLVGSKVTVASAAWIASQSALKRVYVWQTAVDNPEGIKALTDARGSGAKLEVIGADLPLAQPTTAPMPEDPAPAPASTEQPKQ
ncbi:MAG: c-type cytochrome domain-containing protein [bacterium]